MNKIGTKGPWATPLTCATARIKPARGPEATSLTCATVIIINIAL